jgi:hypothetical protein
VLQTFLAKFPIFVQPGAGQMALLFDIRASRFRPENIHSLLERERIKRIVIHPSARLRAMLFEENFRQTEF